MKWCYFTSKGPVYTEIAITARVDIAAHAKPARALMVLKNNTAGMSDWLVCDYLTGAKVASGKTRKAARAMSQDGDFAIKVLNGLKTAAAQGLILPEVNAVNPEY